MISGKLLNLLPLLKDMIVARVNKIDFEDDIFDNDIMWQMNYQSTKLLDLINALYQDYITDYIKKNDIIRINLKNYTYEVI